MMNPYAVNLWLLCGSIGYVADEMHGCAVGLVIGTSLSILAAVVGGLRK